MPDPASGLWNAGVVDWWLIGLIALCVAGVAVIAYGALWDRRKYRQAVAQMLNPPARDIPQLPANAGTPAYVTRDQARRCPISPAQHVPATTTGAGGISNAAALDATDRTELARQLTDPSTVTIPAGYASADFVTIPATGQAVLEHPLVLASAQPIMALRELIGLLEHVVVNRTGIVIAAPSMSGDVLETLAINRIQRRLAVLVVVSSDPSPIDSICAATGAHLTGRIDLQSGYLSASGLGNCYRWVSDGQTSYVIKAPGSARPGLVQP